MQKRSLMPGLALAALLGAWAPAPARATQALYAVDHRIDLPGDTGWDYSIVDPAAQRLYLSRGVRVDVLDTRSERIVGSIADTYGVHGIALAPDLGKGYTSNGLSSTVRVFDLKTLAPGALIPVGAGPDAILYEPKTRRVFTFNGKGHDATVIDAATDKVIATIPLGCKPEFAATDGQGTVYVNREDKDGIAVIDAQRLKVTALWPLRAHSPSGLAIDTAGHRLFSVCRDGKMEVVDTLSGRVSAEVAIGQHPDAAAFDPGSGLAFSSNGDGTLTVAGSLPGLGFTALDSVKTQAGARTLALDTATHTLYLDCAQYLSAPAQPEGPRGRHPHWRPIRPGSVQLLVLKEL